MNDYVNNDFLRSGPDNMAKYGIERSIKGTFSVFKRTFKATRFNYVNTKISYSLTHGRSEPPEVVILLHLTLLSIPKYRSMVGKIPVSYFET